MHNDSYNDFLDERKMDQLPVVLTPAEAMEILGVGKNTMYRLLASGNLKAFRVGRSWRITSEALELFMMLK